MAFYKPLIRTLSATVLICFCLPVVASDVLKLYGPGGPAPAMKEAAQVFNKTFGIEVKVQAGPTGQWLEQAKIDADFIYSGSENMLSDFARAMPGLFELAEAEPLYLRPLAILVRPGNPQNISGFKDLLRSGLRVLTVAGAGQVGLWEDAAARTGDIQMVRSLRRNLLFPEPANSALARQQWLNEQSIDAWLIWNIWQVSNSELADLIEVEEPWRTYRGTDIVLTERGRTNPKAQQFVQFLQSKVARDIFAKWGWQS